ncbi:PAB7 [Symbiodinium pilosum]|uniref:PAB7 protein n=1 Tax=Symbiodinium pilosum TaxID=2952 RepID=A0A812IL98_SYMPI|nr:PAB7 [Symbiodinium pilosum]
MAEEPCHRVYVRGFDFGTGEDALREHFSQVGPVTSVELWGRGAAAVTYATAEAAQASLTLHRSTVPGNKRFVEVKLDDDPTAGKPGSKVLVRGFDFGTTDEQLKEHCSKAGQIANLQWVSKGSALVTYSSPQEAESAAQILNKTTIEGNKRFIDVMQKDDNFDPRRMMMGMPMFWYANFARAYWGKGKGKGKSDKKEDPPGSGRVFVRGFDFGTTDEQLIAHMSTAGEIETVHWVSKGSAIVVYKEAACAANAVAMLQKSVIGSNTRYIDIVLKDSELLLFSLTWQAARPAQCRESQALNWTAVREDLITYSTLAEPVMRSRRCFGLDQGVWSYCTPAGEL